MTDLQAHIDSDPTPIGIERPLLTVSEEVNRVSQLKTTEPDNKPYDWAQKPEDDAIAMPKADTSYIPEDHMPAPTNEDGTPRRRTHSGPGVPLSHLQEYKRRADEPGYEVARQLGKLAGRVSRRGRL